MFSRYVRCPLCSKSPCYLNRLSVMHYWIYWCVQGIRAESIKISFCLLCSTQLSESGGKESRMKLKDCTHIFANIFLFLLEKDSFRCSHFVVLGILINEMPDFSCLHVYFFYLVLCNYYRLWIIGSIIKQKWHPIG